MTTVVEAWSAVMEDVQAIKKGDRNKQQGFNFRGIDAVMNAVGPVLRKHGVTVVPTAEDIRTSSYETKGGTTMYSAVVKVRFTVHGPDGDTIEGATYGEASDAGDKAVSKAHSVAYRTFLLQALTIPTDEPDPDSESHERAAPTQIAMSGAQLALSAAANQLTGAQRSELRSVLVSRGLPGKAADMSDDEATLALTVLNETFAA